MLCYYVLCYSKSREVVKRIVSYCTCFPQLWDKLAHRHREENPAREKSSNKTNKYRKHKAQSNNNSNKQIHKRELRPESPRAARGRPIRQGSVRKIWDFDPSRLLSCPRSPRPGILSYSVEFLLLYADCACE